MKRFLAVAALLLGPLITGGQAQVTVPNTLTAGATIRASDLNTNFATLGNHALDRLAGGTIAGNITMAPGITIDGIDLSATLCPTCTPTFVGVNGAVSLLGKIGGVTKLTLDATGLTLFGNQLVDSAGKIPALTSTYLASLDASTLTGLNGSAVATGTVSAAVAAETNEVKLYEKACPAGFTDLSASYGGRYIVIMPAGGTLSSQVGTALTNSENRAHTHSVPSLSVAGLGISDSGVLDLVAGATAATKLGTGGAGDTLTWFRTSDNAQRAVTANAAFNRTDANWGAAAHSHGGLTAAGSTGTGTSGANSADIAPYVQLRACRKS